MQRPDAAQLLREIKFSTPIQIRFSDIDGYLHVNNGVYFNYFEHARAVFLHQVCNWDVMATGTVVGRIAIDYYQPIHFEDKVRSLVECSRIGNASFDLEQYLLEEKKDGTSSVYSKCKCTMVTVDMETMKPIQIPEEYRMKLRK